MERYVLDANVVRTALCNPEGPSAHLICEAMHEQTVLLTSFPLFTEYEARCMRPSLWGPTGLMAWQVGDYLDGLAALMRVVTVQVGWLPKLQEVVSELSLVTAVQGDADAIVTLNQDELRAAAAHYDIDVLSPQSAAERVGYV